MQKRREIPISTKMIHLNAKIISRVGEKPQSAVASAAYRSATKIYCEYDGEVKDFSRKGHVIYGTQEKAVVGKPEVSGRSRNTPKREGKAFRKEVYHL